jgi:hypothetical protein
MSSYAFVSLPGFLGPSKAEISPNKGKEKGQVYKTTVVKVHMSRGGLQKPGARCRCYLEAGKNWLHITPASNLSSTGK